MPIATLKDLLSRVALDVPRCPEAMQEEALRRAFRAFCQDAEAWRPEVTIDLLSGTTDYHLTLPTEADITRIDQIRMRSAADVTARAAGIPIHGDEVEITGESPNYRLQFGLPAYRVATGSKLVLRVVAVPRMGPESDGDIGEAMLNEWGDAIAAKAIADLCAVKGRPYSNPDLWLLRSRDYNQAVSRARRFALGGRTGKVGFTR